MTAVVFTVSVVAEAAMTTLPAEAAAQTAGAALLEQFAVVLYRVAWKIVFAAMIPPESRRESEPPQKKAEPEPICILPLMATLPELSKSRPLPPF